MLTAEKRDALLGLSTALVVDARSRLGLPECVLDPAIRPVAPMSRMVGTAVTMLMQTEYEPEKANLDAYTRAFQNVGDLLAPIMVVEVPPAHHHRGVFGEGSATSARRNGFVGALVDGAVRDTHELTEMAFPVFSRAVAPGYIVGKVTAISSGDPVRIGGVSICAHDIVFGDNDGLTVIAPADLDPVLEKAMAIRKWERGVLRIVDEGLSIKEAIARAGDMP